MQESTFAPRPGPRVSWQSSLASLLVLAALAVLAYGFLVRPWLSATVGREVGREIQAQLSAEIGALALSAPAPASAPADDAAAGQPAQLQPIPAEPGAPATSVAAALGEQLGTASAGQAGQAPEALPAPAQSDAIAAGSAASESTTAGSSAGAAPAYTAGAPAASAPGQAASAGPAPAGASQPLIGTPSQGDAPPTPVPLATAIPEVIAALPPGELVLSEAQVNRRVQERIAGQGPIEEATMRFVPGELQVALKVLGTDNLVRASLAINAGRIVVRSPQLSGPLALVLSVDDLVDPLEEQINVALDATDRALRDVRIEQGRLVVTIE